MTSPLKQTYGRDRRLRLLCFLRLIHGLSAPNCLIHNLLLSRIEIVRCLTAVIEDHCCLFVCIEALPQWNPRVIGISVSCEIHPRGGDPARQDMCGFATAGHMSTKIGIVKNKRHLRTVERHRPPIQYRRLPSKLIAVHGGRLLSFSLSQKQRRSSHTARRNDRP